MAYLKNKSGFSLVELSVVLVIAGLVMAAIASGAHLMQAAKINKVVSEISGYVTAVNNFKDKYKAWPGDMPNATSFWGVYNVSTNPTGTVNGNGNGRMGNGFNGEILTEGVRSWQQMSLAGMIAGAYTGIDAGTPDFIADINVPGSKGALKGSFYYLYYHINHYSTTGNALELGGITPSNDMPWGTALTPADAHIVDVKMDDGLASDGNLYGIRANQYDATAGKCVNAAVIAASADYILTDTVVSCRMLYWLNK